MRYTALILILLAGTANAETFECKAGEYPSSGAKVVVTATINEDGETGTIMVAGTTQNASYSVAGFDRRWNFGPARAEYDYRYAFVIKPDGTANYFDFSLIDDDGKVTSSQRFVCKQTK